MKPWCLNIKPEIGKSLEDALNLDRKRVNELILIIQDASRDSTIVELSSYMAFLADKAENPNEFAYMILLIGEEIGKRDKFKRVQEKHSNKN